MVDCRGDLDVPVNGCDSGDHVHGPANLMHGAPEVLTTAISVPYTRTSRSEAILSKSCAMAGQRAKGLHETRIT